MLIGKKYRDVGSYTFSRTRFNECINTLNGTHPDCSIAIVNPETVNAKFLSIVKEKIFFHLAKLYLLQNKDLNFMHNNTEHLTEEMLEMREVKEMVNKELREHFKDHIGIDNIKKAIKDAMESIEFIEADTFNPEEIKLENFIKILQTINDPQQRYNLIINNNNIKNLFLKFIKNEENLKFFCEKLFSDCDFKLDPRDIANLKKLLSITLPNVTSDEPITRQTNNILQEQDDDDDLLAQLYQMMTQNTAGTNNARRPTTTRRYVHRTTTTATTPETRPPVNNRQPLYSILNRQDARTVTTGQEQQQYPTRVTLDPNLVPQTLVRRRRLATNTTNRTSENTDQTQQPLRRIGRG